MASPVARLFPLRPLLRKPRALLFAPYTPTVLRFIRFASAAGIKVDCAVPYDVSNMTYVLIKAYGGKPVYFPSAPWKLPLQLSKLTALDPNSPSSEYFQPQPYEFLPGLRDNLFRLFNLLKSTDGVIWWRVSRRDWHNNPKWTLKLENAEPLLFQYCTQSDFRWYIEEMGIRPVIETINFIDSMTPYRAPKVLTCSLRPAGVPKPNSTVSLSKLRWSKWTSIHGAFSDKALFPTSRQQSDVEEELKFDRTGESVAPLSPPTGGSLDVDLFLRTIVELVFSGFKSFHEIDLDDMPCPQTDSPRDIQKTVLAYFQRHHGGISPSTFLELLKH